jgi:hypothetical protein
VYGQDIACFLGSGQTDSSIEARAFRGDFLIIYITPEKLLNSFDSLGRYVYVLCIFYIVLLYYIFFYIYKHINIHIYIHRLHKERGIGLLAVDEAQIHTYIYLHICRHIQIFGYVYVYIRTHTYTFM